MAQGGRRRLQPAVPDGLSCSSAVPPAAEKVVYPSLADPRISITARRAFQLHVRRRAAHQQGSSSRTILVIICPGFTAVSTFLPALFASPVSVKVFRYLVVHVGVDERTADFLERLRYVDFRDAPSPLSILNDRSSLSVRFSNMVFPIWLQVSRKSVRLQIRSDFTAARFVVGYDRSMMRSSPSLS